ncbi:MULTISPECIES: type IV pilin protein [Geobacter]|uniref:type IV pilin protein n=1 Tax=Geobacter TaxID=28231 RepID=UPI00257425F8|nr:prepilin-type N-terminal cleavage/methylation domain-containing protein [Geobacter sulfurreducens]BEH10229.1 prepilin-type N-terminal cleavage/methylation domain-containing protein [Geobacter sulfurreducens subsp. ethanolicus]BET58185.1 prepilin-type N-terminal cleavage/methylation domain-containing protein [Geobacter sp. 60473]
MLKCLRNRKGFTLIELMIVVTIIGILAAIAVPNYRWGLIRAREAVLQENLYTMRSAIDQYYADQGKYPDTLDEMAEKRYLKSIPYDPFTGKNDTWVTVKPIEPTGEIHTAEEIKGNVADVHSGSDLVSSKGTPYKDW